MLLQKLLKQDKVLVIVPAYNEYENLVSLVDKLRGVDPKVDILVVNDHSTDGTAKICNELGVNTIHLPCNLGIGGAVQTGYKYAQLNGYSYAVQVDGDGQHDPNYIHEILQPLLAGQATDPTSGFRACNAKVITLFARFYPTDYPEPESIVLMKRNGFTIIEVPVIMQERLAGASSIRSFKTIYYMIKVSLAILIDKMRRNIEVDR